MSPAAKKSTLNVFAVIGAVVAVVGLTDRAATAMNNTYVSAERYRADSINNFYRQKFIAERLASIDSIKADMDTVKAMLRRRER